MNAAQKALHRAECTRFPFNADVLKCSVGQISAAGPAAPGDVKASAFNHLFISSEIQWLLFASDVGTL